MAGKKISEELKKKVVKTRNSGLTIKKTAEKCGISETSVRRIMKENSEESNSPNQKTESAAIERKKRIEEINQRIVAIENKIEELEKDEKPCCS